MKSSSGKWGGWFMGDGDVHAHTGTHRCTHIALVSRLELGSFLPTSVNINYAAIKIILHA